MHKKAGKAVPVTRGLQEGKGKDRRCGKQADLTVPTSLWALTEGLGVRKYNRVIADMVLKNILPTYLRCSMHKFLTLLQMPVE